MAKEELISYLQELGLSETAISRLFNETTMGKVDTIKRKVEFYKTFFGVNTKEIVKMLSTSAIILNSTIDDGTTSSIQNKVLELKQTLNISLKEAKQIVLKCPYLISRDISSDSESSLKSKIEFIERYFGLSQNEARKLAVKSPVILARDTNKIAKKVEFISSYLNIDIDTSKNMIIKVPEILGHDMEQNTSKSIISKVECLKNCIKIDDKLAKQLCVRFPTILTYSTSPDSETSIVSKLNFYKSELKLSEEELSKIVIKLPTILGMDITKDSPTSVNLKIQKLREITGQHDIKEIILTNPYIFSVPAQSLKIRYMLATIADLKDKFLYKTSLTSERKVWARYCFLKKFKDDYRGVYWAEKVFSKVFNENTDNLLKMYPLDKDALVFIEKNYNKLSNNKLTLDSNEQQEPGEE